MGSETKPRTSMLEKILGPDAVQALEAEQPETLKDSRPAVPTPMLDLVMRDGSVESFSYAYLTRVSYEPTGRLVLCFGEDEVEIVGRNLMEIREKVRLHRANEINEGVEAYQGMRAEGAAYVERIQITKGSKEPKEAARHDTGRSKGTQR